MQRTIILPDLGQTTSEAKIVQWLKKPGERVARGEPIVAVATDKVDMEVEAFEGGYIRELLAKEGSLATALAPLAILTDEPDEDYQLNSESDVAPQSAGGRSPQTTTPVADRPQYLNATPAARTLAREFGVDLTEVAASKASGLITRADVQRSVDTHSTSDRNRALAAMASTTVASKRDIPHFYAKRDLVVTAAACWRVERNRANKDEHATFTDVFVWCAAKALADVPRLNLAYAGGKFEQRETADVLLVVARDPAMLLVPVRDPRVSGWEGFLQRMHKRSLAGESGSSGSPLLAISNLGMYGLTEFSAVIPPGCSSALAIGAVREAAIVRHGAIAIEQVVTFTLSADHRVIDGVAAARFLERIQIHLDSL